MDKNLIKVKKINNNLFNAYVMFVREPLLTFSSKELEYYANEDSTILGTIILDGIDDDFNCVILCRDEVEKFKAVEIKTSFSNINEAREWLILNIRQYTLKGITVLPQGETSEGVDLFTSVEKEEKQHPHFKLLKNGVHFYPARKILSEVSRFFDDIDGNFIQQFQAVNGFDARIWEIYLFCLLTEEKFQLIRKYNRPDFMVRKYDVEIAIEAVIVARKKDNPPKMRNGLKVKSPEQIIAENSNDMPLRFGSALFSKIKKEYWKLTHVENKPLIFAIADFHDDMSMTWSYNAIFGYLYGMSYKHYYDEKGSLVVVPEKANPYKKANGKEIEAGFFNTPNSEYISGILFSPNGTISKFNRMGVQAGFKNDRHTLMRFGSNYNHEPNASKPHIFQYEVTEECQETWSEGMNLFHNPNALYPIDKQLFPSIAHHEFADGYIVSENPEFHPFSSFDMNSVST